MNAVTKVRAVLGFGNQAAHAVFAQVNEALQQEFENARHLVALNPFSWRIQSASGEWASPDELLQAIESGVRLSVGDTLRTGDDAGDLLRGNATYGKVDWPTMVSDFHLGVQFDSVRELWDDVVWNGFQVQSNDDGTTFCPKDDHWVVRYRVSLCRTQYLFMQHLSQALQFVRRLPNEHVYRSVPKPIRSVIRTGGRCRIVVGDRADVDFDEAAKWLATTSYAKEPYYDELLSATHDTLAGGSGNDLIAAWSVIRGVAKHLFGFEATARNEGEIHAWIADYVPVVEVDILARAVSTSTGVSLEKARALVSFLTFNGRHNQELYSQPLIPVGPTSVSPCLAAIRSPNIRRLVDIWIRQLGVDLEQRGPAFERYIREEVATFIQSSPMLNVGKLFPGAMNFTVSSAQTEEIDLVVVVGKLVLIGETKCMLQPTDASDIARHRERVIEAARQIQRKADAIRQNRGDFRQQLKALGIECAVDFDLQPLVVLNTPIHTGFAVAGVPVVDEHMLRVFFGGELQDAILGGNDGEAKVVKRLALYDGIDGLAEKAAEYFTSPPQLDIWKRSVMRRTITVPAVSAGDWTGRYITVECSPRLEGTTLHPDNSY
ncbi:hypothetical protein PQR12_23500 [Paraburkholderia nemoris]|uniref:hypothetical protein n=1 Tax=Paraburkholderia nemoris TaxID=2793076 RepID=UPI0038B9643E